jgi:hypothetical protein
MLVQKVLIEFRQACDLELLSGESAARLVDLRFRCSTAARFRSGTGRRHLCGSSKRFSFRHIHAVPVSKVKAEPPAHEGEHMRRRPSLPAMWYHDTTCWGRRKASHK